MGYLLTEILACMLLAGLIGIFIGWWLRGGCTDKLKKYKEEWDLKLKNTEIENETKIRALVEKHDSKMKYEHDFYNAKIKNIESSHNLKYKTEQNMKEENIDKVKILTLELQNAQKDLEKSNKTWTQMLKDTETKWENKLKNINKSNSELEDLKKRLIETENKLKIAKKKSQI